MLLLAFFRRRKSASRIKWVAEAFRGDLSEFRERAKIAANELGSQAIDSLVSQFHAEHTPPPELAQAFAGLTQWMTARQFAIFKLLYNFGSPAIPALRRVAFGDYDWVQGSAIEILCRLAADGTNHQEIISSLIAHLPDIREEAHFYALGPLLQQSPGNQDLQNIINQLLVVPEFKSSYEHVLLSHSGL